jgi:hypothetical protein
MRRTIKQMADEWHLNLSNQHPEFNSEEYMIATGVGIGIAWDELNETTKD